MPASSTSSVHLQRQQSPPFPSLPGRKQPHRTKSCPTQLQLDAPYSTNVVNHARGPRSPTASSCSAAQLWKPGNPILFSPTSPSAGQRRAFQNTASAKAYLKTGGRMNKGPGMSLEEAMQFFSESPDVMEVEAQNAASQQSEYHDAVEHQEQEEKREDVDAFAPVAALREETVALQRDHREAIVNIDLTLRAADDNWQSMVQDLKDVLAAVSEELDTRGRTELSEEVESEEQIEYAAAGVVEEEEETSDLETEDSVEIDYPELSYQIPEDVLEARMALADTTDAERWWDHTLYKDAEGKSVEVHYCKSAEESEPVIAKFLEDKVVGFDLEWVAFRAGSSVKNNVSMIQVANEHSVALVHVAHFKEDDASKFVCPSLRKLLESEDIIKTGVMITNDCYRVRKFLGIEPRGIFELSDLHNLIVATEEGQYRVSKKVVALARLTEMYLHLPLFKGDDVRQSNWSKELGEKQILYAAADPYAHFRVFDALERKRAGLKPMPRFPAFRELKSAEELAREAAAPKKKWTKTASVAASATATETETDTAASAENLTPTTTTTSSSTIQIELDGSTRSISESESEPESDSDEASDTLIPGSEMEEVEVWVKDYQSGQPNSSSLRHTHLRAYALWYNKGYDIDTIREACRQHPKPAVKRSTVSVYLLEAIKGGQLPYDRERAAELGKEIPWVMRPRYSQYL